MPTINLSSPWVILYHEMQAMFKNDKGVKVILDEDTKNISIYVEDDEKAAALTEILAPTFHFGNIVTNVVVVPANKFGKTPASIEDAYKKAFKDNPALSYTKYINLPLVSHNIYVVFKNEVVQYFNDDMMDVNGFCSTLYQEIAKTIFVSNPDTYCVCFCTDTPDNLGAPLGEWP